MKAFFDAIRPAFKGKLSQAQVDGMTAILGAAKRYGVTDRHHVAYALATVRHETGGYMSPIKETVYASHKDKNPSDEVVAARLEAAWKAGKLKWVKTPYWRPDANGKRWFGRGQTQITHEDNYLKFGITNPDDALRLDVSAMVVIVGMRDGKFRGKRLSQYTFPGAVDLPPDENPRRIINGQDGTDATVAGYYRQFYAALGAIDLDAAPVAPAAPAPAPAAPPPKPAAAPQTAKPAAPAPASAKGIAAVVALLIGAIGAAVAAFFDQIAEWFRTILGG